MGEAVISGTNHGIVRIGESEIESVHSSLKSIGPALPCTRHHAPGTELGPGGRTVAGVQLCF